jgi:hypothetical protein
MDFTVVSFNLLDCSKRVLLIKVFTECLPSFLDGLEFLWPDFLCLSFDQLVVHRFLFLNFNHGIHPLVIGYFVSCNWLGPMVNNLLFVGPVEVTFSSFLTNVEMSVFDLVFDGLGVSFVDLKLLLNEFVVGNISSSIWFLIQMFLHSDGVSDSLLSIDNRVNVVAEIFFNFS